MTKQEFNQEYKTREQSMETAFKNNDYTMTGAHLKWIRDNRKNISLLDGYTNIYDYAKDLLGLKRTMTCCIICVADTFGEKDDNGVLTGVLKVKYRSYDFSQLNEMRALSPALLKTVTPDMSVREIKRLVRSIKPAPERKKTVLEQIADTAALLSPEDQDRLLKITIALANRDNTDVE